MKSIVFDLDGTLIDSAPDIHRIANLVLLRQGCETVSLDQARSFIGNGSSIFIEKLRKARDLPDSLHESMLAEFMTQYLDAHELTTVYPGVFEALEVLKQNGHALGICTNKPIEPCKSVLQNMKLDHYFDTVLGGDSLSARKPDPAPLHAAFESLNTGLSGIYVGDSEVDAETAQRAEVPFLLFTEGYRKRDISDMPFTKKFSGFNELPNIIFELLT